MVTELESTWDRYLRRINAPKHRIDLINEEFRPICYAVYRVEPFSVAFVTMEIELMLAESAIEPETTKWVLFITFAPWKDDFLPFCADH